MELGAPGLLERRGDGYDDLAAVGIPRGNEVAVLNVESLGTQGHEVPRAECGVGLGCKGEMRIAGDGKLGFHSRLLGLFG